MNNSYQLCNAVSKVSLCITHTIVLYAYPHVSTCRWNISFICIVLCELVGVQTCVSCCVMLSSRWILSPLPQAWGKCKTSLSFMFYYHSSASLLIQAASAGQCITISKHCPGNDFYFQGDGIMFFSGWLTTDSMAGWLCVHLCSTIHISLSTWLSMCSPCVSAFFSPVSISLCWSVFMITFFSICPKTSLRSFSSWSVMSFLIPLENLFIFTFSVHFSLLFSPFLAA